MCVTRRTDPVLSVCCVSIWLREAAVRGAEHHLGAADPKGIQPQHSAADDERTRRGGRRVLIVEDEVLIRLDLERELAAAGFEIVGAAASADEAVGLAEQEEPDAVLMDVRLIGARDGVDAALELWDRFKIRSVFVSGNIDDAMKERAAAAQPLGFVSKPFSTSHIVALLRTGNN
jgi:CheY-like chemotaxis protein